MFFVTPTLAKDSKIKYSRENISNYFLGIISLNQNYTSSSYKYFNKIQSLKKNHSNYNIQFIRSLVLLEKFDQAFKFSKEIFLPETAHKTWSPFSIILKLFGKYFNLANFFMIYSLYIII